MPPEMKRGELRYNDKEIRGGPISRFSKPLQTIFDGRPPAGYSRALAVGLVTTVGSLGILIPPSVRFIIYRVAIGTLVGVLFAAGVVSGHLLGAMFMVFCVVYARSNGISADPPPDFQIVRVLGL